ncbi:DUF4328 domain-containing protein [Streptomyces sp. NBC_01198]|uniref:DUF4328 domain-containing protein n=1 Tax=Streptomyces sp. NBC_01198 TaxID=2903769 RepID=UPI002E0EC0DF|nr:DUF4328 domain-containing protein [Streptomyces sp. NBC_01198]
MSTTLPAKPYRDARLLATVTVALLCLAFACDIANVVMNLHIASVTDAMIHRPSTVTSAEIRGVDRLRHDVLPWLTPAQLAAVAVPFVALFRRSRLNAESFAPGAMKVAEGWAVGGWVVPVAALWMPLRVAHDIRRGSALPDSRNLVTAVLVNSWWALWLGNSLGVAVLPTILDGVLLDRADYDTDVAAVSAHAYAVADVVSGVFGLLAAIAAVLVVHAVTVQQRARAAAGGLVSPQVAHVFPAPGQDIAGA